MTLETYYFESVLYSKENANQFYSKDIFNYNDNKKDISLRKAKKEAKELSKNKKIPHIATTINKIGDSTCNYICSYRVVPFYSAMVVEDSNVRAKIKEYYNSSKYIVNLEKDYFSGDLKVRIKEK